MIREFTFILRISGYRLIFDILGFENPFRSPISLSVRLIRDIKSLLIPAFFFQILVFFTKKPLKSQKESLEF